MDIMPDFDFDLYANPIITMLIIEIIQFILKV